MKFKLGQKNGHRNAYFHEETKRLEEHFALADKKLITIRKQMDIKETKKVYLKDCLKNNYISDVEITLANWGLI